MGTFYIKKGRNIRVKGTPLKKIVEGSTPSHVAVQPPDFGGLRLRLLVHEGDPVNVGTPLLTDKAIPEIQIVSPASGKVAAINRGEKRSLQEVVIETDGHQSTVEFRKFTKDEIKTLSRQNIIEQLLESGLWPCIRQRPFSKVAHPKDHPKSIFIQAMNTEPLALDVDFILRDKQEQFQFGLDIIGRLTERKVHLCFDSKAQSKALTQAKGAQLHQFSGPHPTGNVSTHIHYIDSIHKGDMVWYLGAQDVLRIASLFLEGKYPSERYVALTGEGIDNRQYIKTVMGASFNDLLDGDSEKGPLRYISGSILSGKNIGRNGFLCFYDSQITVIPEGGKRRFLGWLMPGFNLYSFSRAYASSFLPRRDVSLNTDTHGSERAIVLNHIYDSLVPLEILTFFLLRAVIAGDIEEAEKLGILECDEEDFALCSFACPSKIDVGAIIREGLDVIEKEG